MSMRVAILPTGLMEWTALPLALGRLFPGHDFYSLPSERERCANPGVEFPVPSFTSTDVSRLLGRASNADKLVQRALGEALGDRNKAAADLVVILDDLELVNLAQPAKAVEVMHKAVVRVLDGIRKDRGDAARQARALRERVSFHLAKPMIEAWLFADPQGAGHAGVSPDRLPPRVSPCDPECFQTDDSDYDTDDGSHCTAWMRLPPRKQRRARPIWDAKGRERQAHPKAYLSWLCRDDNEPNCTSYKESEGGAAALTRLDWRALIGDATYCTFARAMVHDIAHCLGEAGPAGFPGDCAKETDLAAAPQDKVLRNL
jgi:hypothetical protein